MRQSTSAFVVVLVLVGTVAGSASAGVATNTRPAAVQANDQFEPNDTMGTAASLRNVSGQQLQVVSGESDYFAIELTAGETLDVGVDFSHADGDLDAYAYAPNGTMLDSSFSVTDGEHVTVTAPTDGTYYVEVVGYNGASAPYYLGWSVENNDRFDQTAQNDDRAGATNLSTGYYQQLTVIGGESDVYAVDLQSGERLDAAIEFVHVSGDLDMELYGPNGQLLDGSYSVTDAESVSTTASQDGTYYVEVYGWNGATARYNLSLSSPDARLDDRLEDNDARSTATNVSAFSFHDDMQITESDHDFYAVELQRGEQLNASLAFDHNVADLDLRVYDDQGYPVARNTSTSDGEHVSVTARQSGTYYVLVSGYTTGDTAPYDLLVRSQNDRFEMNGYFDSAQSIGDRDYEDLRIENGESDYFAIRLSQGEQLDVTTEFDHGTGDLDLTVYDPGRSYVTSSLSTTDNESVSVTASQSGVYYVEVEGWNGATAPYDLRVDTN